jgi:hypothetical protein
MRAAHKYHAISTEVDGIKFPSRLEARRYQELKLLVAAKEIFNLRLQVAYPINVNNKFVCSYVADFVYEENGKTVVEDSKGMPNPIFRLKAKLLKAVHGIDILVTHNAR